MKKMLFLMTILILFIESGCKDSSLNPSVSIVSVDIIGSWKQVTAFDSNTVALQKEIPLDTCNGFIFYPDGRFDERTLNWKCGTPPIPYYDEIGKWAFVTDSKILITLPVSQRAYYLQIVHITATKLTVKVVYI